MSSYERKIGRRRTHLAVTRLHMAYTQELPSPIQLLLECLPSLFFALAFTIHLHIIYSCAMHRECAPCKPARFLEEADRMVIAAALLELTGEVVVYPRNTSGVIRERR